MRFSLLKHTIKREFCKNRSKKGAIIKCDFEKAYDKLNWDYGLEVNSATRELMMGRGLRQGDTISPFLFLIASEGLNILMERAMLCNIFKGISIGQSAICNLQPSAICRCYRCFLKC